MDMFKTTEKPRKNPRKVLKYKFGVHLIACNRIKQEDGTYQHCGPYLTREDRIKFVSEFIEKAKLAFHGEFTADQVEGLVDCGAVTALRLLFNSKCSLCPWCKGDPNYYQQCGHCSFGKYVRNGERLRNRYVNERSNKSTIGEKTESYQTIGRRNFATN